MTHFSRISLACLCATLLTSCGGEDANPTAAPSPSTVTSGKSSAQQVRVAADYYPVVQRIYLAYFGRPADPGGLDFYATQYMNGNAALDVRGVIDAYNSNAVVHSLIDSFGTSQESKDLYPGDNDVFVTAIYRNLLSREPDLDGKAYWTAAINNGTLTRGNAAVAIMAGAQGADLDLINKRAQVVINFTAALNTPSRIKAYSGLAANSVVRATLSAVTTNTDLSAFQSTIESVINSLVAALPGVSYAQIAPIIAARCQGCHSVRPTIPGFNPAPLGITLDNEAEVRGNAARIYANVVQSQNMPFGNFTNMTQAERDLYGAWFNAGQP